MSTATTPNDAQRPARQRSTSRTRIPSRPTTPLRPSSRASLRNSQQASSNAHFDPISALEGQFAEFSDAMADLEANFMHLQLMHESLSRFSESFAAFLYGLNMNAFCIDFTEGPVAESFKRAHLLPSPNVGGLSLSNGHEPDIDATFLTTDTSFVENPPTSSKVSSKFSTPAPTSKVARGGIAGRGAPAGRGRASGIARSSTRGRGRGGSMR